MLDSVRLLRRPRGIVTALTKRHQQSHQLRFRAYVPKATMHGQLIRYGKNSAQVGFICDPPASKALILLGGLTDGLLALPYVNALVEELAPKGWCVVQAQLRSSYQVDRYFIANLASKQALGLASCWHHARPDM